MSENTEKITVKLIDDQVKFAGHSEARPDTSVIFDYKEPIGTGNGFNGLELLLLSFSGCVATAVVFLLRKMKKDINGFSLQATGVRTTEVPVKFSTIDLEFTLRSNNTTDVELDKSIKLAEESVCPVWQMIKGNVAVSARGRVVAP